MKLTKQNKDTPTLKSRALASVTTAPVWITLFIASSPAFKKSCVFAAHLYMRRGEKKKLNQF
jgi:hypothetical protein